MKKPKIKRTQKQLEIIKRDQLPEKEAPKQYTPSINCTQCQKALFNEYYRIVYRPYTYYYQKPICLDCHKDFNGKQPKWCKPNDKK